MSREIMNQIAVMNVQYVQYSFDFFLDSMAKCGVKNIELWTGAPHFYYEDYLTYRETSKKIKKLKGQIEDLGMKVICLTPEQLNYPINLAAKDERLRTRTVDYFSRHMEMALEFGTDQLFITSGSGLRDVQREESWKYSRESLEILAEKAEITGIKLIMEQLQPYESNLITTRSDIERMLQEVDSSSLQCCVDVVAMAVVKDELEDFFKSLEGRIQHIHLADGNPSGHYILGDGSLPIIDYLKTLDNNKYDRYITLEINDSIYLTDPHLALKRSTDYLRNVLLE
ncbi:TIM barrel protein [Mesobacillus foraminis]|uniref:sugar phosphate isomerase/epimerase family protein n=1 Tax=Mesobacillus foraminis TaxID=279826 RepID=UPI00399F9BCE